MLRFSHTHIHFPDLTTSKYLASELNCLKYKCLQREEEHIHCGDWATYHIRCIIPISTGTVASWKDQDRAVCITSRNAWGKSPWAGTVDGTYWWPTFTASERNCAECNNCTPCMDQTFRHNLTVFFCLQTNFTPLYLICFLWSICLIDSKHSPVVPCRQAALLDVLAWWCRLLEGLYCSIMCRELQTGQVENAEVRKPKCGNRSTEAEVRRKAAYRCLVPYCNNTNSRLCLVGKGWLSSSHVRAEYWHTGLLSCTNTVV